MPCSGKSEAVRIAKDRGIQVIRMGDMIWTETKNQGLKLNDKNVGQVANSMRDKHGMDIWARRTVEAIKMLKKSDYIVVDGIRNLEEINFFKKELSKDFVIITIDAPDELRKNRALSRGRKDDSNNIKNIEERDKRELKWGISDVIASADVVVSNEGGIEEFRNKVRKMLDGI